MALILYVSWKDSCLIVRLSYQDSYKNMCKDHARTVPNPCKNIVEDSCKVLILQETCHTHARLLPCTCKIIAMHMQDYSMSLLSFKSLPSHMSLLSLITTVTRFTIITTVTTSHYCVKSPPTADDLIHVETPPDDLTIQTRDMSEIQVTVEMDTPL